MRRGVAILMLVVFPVTVFAQESDVSEKPKTADYDTGFYDGEMSASENYGGGGWFAAGLGGGLLLGLIGGGIVVGISQSGTVDPPASHRLGISDQSNDYKMGYYDGFSKKAKKKRLGNSIIGGLIGTAVIVAILANAQE
jgi:hypothetical protein